MSPLQRDGRGKTDTGLGLLGLNTDQTLRIASDVGWTLCHVCSIRSRDGPSWCARLALGCTSVGPLKSGSLDTASSASIRTRSTCFDWITSPITFLETTMTPSQLVEPTSVLCRRFRPEERDRHSKRIVGPINRGANLRRCVTWKPQASQCNREANYQTSEGNEI